MTWRKTTAVFLVQIVLIFFFFQQKWLDLAQVFTTYEFMKHSPCSRSTNTIITTQLSDLQCKLCIKHVKQNDIFIRYMLHFSRYYFNENKKLSTCSNMVHRFLEVIYPVRVQYLVHVYVPGTIFDISL